MWVVDGHVCDAIGGFDSELRGAELLGEGV